MAQYQKALEIDPQQCRRPLRLGQCSGLAADALTRPSALMKRRLRIQPDQAIVRRNLGFAQAQRKALHDALAEAARVACGKIPTTSLC